MNIKTIASAVLAAVVLCAAPAFADGKMNLNTATEQELSANPRRGPRAGQGSWNSAKTWATSRAWTNCWKSRALRPKCSKSSSRP